MIDFNPDTAAKLTNSVAPVARPSAPGNRQQAGGNAQSAPSGKAAAAAVVSSAAANLVLQQVEDRPRQGERGPETGAVAQDRRTASRAEVAQAIAQYEASLDRLGGVPARLSTDIAEAHRPDDGETPLSRGDERPTGDQLDVEARNREDLKVQLDRATEVYRDSQEQASVARTAFAQAGKPETGAVQGSEAPILV